MNARATKRLAAVLLLVLSMLVLCTSALAQSGGPYELTWSTVDGGGETFSIGGDYSLGGTAGQPDAGVLEGGDYTLAGGFWAGVSPVQYRIYLPLLVRDA
jgi:hypothetical protein